MEVRRNAHSNELGGDDSNMLHFRDDLVRSLRRLKNRLWDLAFAWPKTSVALLYVVAVVLWKAAGYLS